MEILELEEALNELSSAEEFLDYFAVRYEPAVVQVNRLHILQRFHDYIEKQASASTDAMVFDDYRKLLARAYQDFVASDALTEKVFRVFQHHEPQAVFLPWSELVRESP